MQLNILDYPVTLKYLNNDVFDVSELVDNYSRRTKFNYLYLDFDLLFKDLSTFKLDERSIKVLPQTKDLIKAFEVIKSYANTDKLTVEFAKETLMSYQFIYTKLEERYHWMELDSFIVPLRGGGIISKLFKLDKQKVLEIEAKRLPLKRELGVFGLGMNFQGNVDQLDNFMDSLSGKEVAILEVCIATGMTTLGFLLDLYIRKVKPKKIVFLTSASSKQGTAVIQAVARQLDFSVEFVTGMMVDNLIDYYSTTQDLLAYNDGSFVVKSPELAYRKYSV